MSDKKPVQADGGSAPPQSQSRSGGTGESGGGAYPNPHTGKPGKNDPGSFMGHGGQSEIDYSGGDNPNEVTEKED